LISLYRIVCFLITNNNWIRVTNKNTVSLCLCFFKICLANLNHPEYRCFHLRCSICQMSISRAYSDSKKSESLIWRILMMCLWEQTEVRSQDSVFVIAGVTGSVDGRELAWKFVCDNWTVLHERYNGMLFLLPRVIKVSLGLQDHMSSILFSCSDLLLVMFPC